VAIVKEIFGILWHQPLAAVSAAVFVAAPNKMVHNRCVP